MLIFVWVRWERAHALVPTEVWLWFPLKPSGFCLSFKFISLPLSLYGNAPVVLRDLGKAGASLTLYGFLYRFESFLYILKYLPLYVDEYTCLFMTISSFIGNKAYYVYVYLYLRMNVLVCWSVCEWVLW